MLLKGPAGLYPITPARIQTDKSASAPLLAHSLKVNVSDSHTWNHMPPRRPDPPAQRRLAVLFRLVGVSRRPIRCATYETLTGTELCIEYEDRYDIIITQLFRPGDEDAIAAKAVEWRAAFDERGFTELPID
jgi:hypothetical protein